jgi:hypothetical protein
LRQTARDLLRGLGPKATALSAPLRKRLAVLGHRDVRGVKK